MGVESSLCFGRAARLGVMLSIAAILSGCGDAPAKPQAGKGGGRQGAGQQVVPVAIAKVETRDLPVYLNGLGSVEAFNTVVVKSRVDGQLVKVAFREGQQVKEGDLLAIIDPRPFEIQLKQAEATLAKDQAQAAQARLLLTRNEALRKENLIAQEQLDEQRATVAQLEAAVQADRAQVDNAKLMLTYSRITSPLNGR